jgi:hypothetical protein
MHHGVGQQAASNTLKGQRLTPVEGVREQSDGRRREDDPQAKAEEARHGRAGRALPHPAPAKPAQQDRQQERGDADGLEDQIGQPCADQAGPVMCLPVEFSAETAAQAGAGMRARGESAQRVRGGIGGSVGSQRQQEQSGAGQHHEADDLVEPPVASWS